MASHPNANDDNFPVTGTGNGYQNDLTATTNDRIKNQVIATNELHETIADFNKSIKKFNKQSSVQTDEIIRLTKYPYSTYWLTTHDWQGENRAKDALSPHLKPETVALLDKVKPSKRKELKTDAINFEKDFLWFDGDLWPDELKVMEDNNATDRFVMVDLQKTPTYSKNSSKSFSYQSQPVQTLTNKCKQRLLGRYFLFY